jgi:hypothetical protein
MPTPVESMRLVATELQPLGVPFAFIGGCAVWLLVDAPEFTDFRPTDDVDIIIEVVTLVEYYGLEDRLRAAGCQNDMSEGAPICRWIIKGCRVDIMPIDSKALGMNSKWFPEALESATITDLGAGQTARVITAPLFVATKLAAFHDRGRMDVYCSHDLEDIVTVVDGREDIVETITSSPDDIRNFIARSFQALTDHPDFEDAIVGHLPATFGARTRAADVQKKFAAIAAAA